MRKGRFIKIAAINPEKSFYVRAAAVIKVCGWKRQDMNGIYHENSVLTLSNGEVAFSSLSMESMVELLGGSVGKS